MLFNIDDLTNRKKEILKAIVDAHIDNGEPVGSKYLTQMKNIALSPATIRNEMAELEEMGFLEQPHTSAGRVPSALGYRFYVDALMNRYAMTAKEISALNTLMHAKMLELDKILDDASKLVSSLTNYTSLALMPKISRTVFKKFSAIMIDEYTFALVMVASTGAVENKSIKTHVEINETVLGVITNVLNQKLTGVTADEISFNSVLEIEGILGEYSPLVNPIIKCIVETLNEICAGELKDEGVNRLLQYPEYSDVERIKNVLGLLEKKDDLLEIVSKSDNSGLNVYIGPENAVDTMNNSTFIFKTIKKNDKVLGAIGVIGPCRMDYSKVITVVDEMSSNIQRMLDAKGSKGDLDEQDD